MIQDITKKIIDSLKDSKNKLHALNNYQIYDTEFFWGNSSFGGQEPIIIQGDNSIVVKMRNDDYEQFAFKCYFDDLSGREERYNLIKKNIRKAKSRYFVDVEYYSEELTVEGIGDIPVLKMKWVEGVDLYTYIDTYIHDEFELKLLAYNFCEFAKWLLEQPFAHGSICTNNIIVNANGDIVVVDYDNMFTPEMEGLKSKCTCDKNFVHPESSLCDFDRYIDNVSLLVTLLSIVTISTYPDLYKKDSRKSHCLFQLGEIANLPSVLPINILNKKNNCLRSIYGVFMSVLGNKKFNLTSDMINLGNPVYENPHRITVKYGTGHFNMVYVEHGDYYRGATPDIKEAAKIEGIDYLEQQPLTYDREAEIDETPIRQEYCGGFWISESFIKNSVWNIRSYGENGYYQELDWSTLNWPITSVRYEEARRLADQLSKSFGLYFDLPTESEWEFAAKGGVLSKHYKYSGSDNIDAVAVHSLTEGTKFSTCPLKTKDPNELGIYDMSGLLFEWCKEEYNPETFKTYSKPIWRHLKDNQKFHVRRGGCMLSDPHECRITCRRRENEFELHDEDGYVIDSLEYYDTNTRKYIDDSNFHGYTGIRLVLRNASPDIIKGMIQPYGISVDEDDTFLNKYNSKISSNGKILVSCEENCRKLIVDNGIEVLGRGCCERNENLLDVELPSSVKVICGQAFWGCKSLERINLGFGIYSIECQAFWGCDKLREVTLPSSLRFMEYGAFSGCNSLRKVCLPDRIEELADNNFSFCSSLEDIYIPNRVKIIPENFLWGCTSLRELTIPESVEIIKGNPFRESGIRKIECKSKHFVFEGGFLMTSDKKAIIACLTDNQDVEVPIGVETIKAEAFEGLTKLKTVKLPEGLKYIERSAFCRCISMENFEIPKTVQHIDECLYECKSLKKISILCSCKAAYGLNIHGTSISKIYVKQEVEKFQEKFGKDVVVQIIDDASYSGMDNNLPF